MKYLILILISTLLYIGISCEKRIVALKITAYGVLDEIPPFSVPDSVLQGAGARLVNSYGATGYYLYYSTNFTDPLYQKAVIVYGKSRDGINYDGIQRIEVDSIRLQ